MDERDPADTTIASIENSLGSGGLIDEPIPNAIRKLFVPKGANRKFTRVQSPKKFTVV